MQIGGSAQGYLDALVKSIRSPNSWDTLVQKERTPRNVKLHLYLAKSLLTPEDAFLFIRKRVNIEDISVYNLAAEIISSISSQLDVKAIIAEFPESDDSIHRALINCALPVPLEMDFVSFLFRSATSSLSMNRESFLTYITKCIGFELPPSIFSLIGKVLEVLSSDRSPSVLASWFEPALYYLKDQPSLPGLIHNLMKRSDPVIRQAVARNIEKIIEIENSFDSLLNDQRPAVMAAFIPKISLLKISESKKKSILLSSSPFLKVQILRFMPDLDEKYIFDCLKSNYLEVLVQTVETIRKRPDISKFVPTLIEMRTSNSTKENEWRIDYQLLEYPLPEYAKENPLISHFVLNCIRRHPDCLRKRAISVSRTMADLLPSHVEEVQSLFKELLLSTRHYDKRTCELLRSSFGLG